MTQIDAVVFDIGNVLIGWQPEQFYDRAVGQARREAMFSVVDLHGMNERVDRGESFAATVADTVAAYPDFADEIQLWHDRWLDMAAPVIDHSVRLLRALRRAGVPVFALSNFGVETFALAEKHYPFLEEFDRRFISGQMRVTKPAAEIYARVETESGVAPGALLFADDRLDNIVAAGARGWQTHLFTTPERFAGRLVDAGLLTPEAAR